MSYLEDIGIVKRCGHSESAKIFEKIFDQSAFEKMCKTMNSVDYVKECWEKYECYKRENFSNERNCQALNGKFLEQIIYTLLYKENIMPFYTQAKMAYVPDADFDVIIYNDNTPVCLSIKASLRERYKQAALEGFALKLVHRNAKVYLLTLDGEEAERQNEKIERGIVFGLDKIVDCFSSDLDALITELKQMSFKKAEPIQPITGGCLVESEA